MDGEWYCSTCKMSPVVNYWTYDPVNPKSFMKTDRHWEEDIKSRRSLPDGSIGRFSPDGKRYE